MKHFLFCILLLASLSACTGASVSSTFQCNKQEGICVNLKVKEPIIPGELVTVIVTVKGEKDIPDLWVSLSAPGNVYFEDPNLKTWKKTGIDWKVDVKAKKLHTFEHKVRLPIEEGFYFLVVGVGTPDYGQMASNGVHIYFSSKEVKVYYAGTQISITDPPLIETVYFSTYTPGPPSIPTATPTRTAIPSYP